MKHCLKKVKRENVGNKKNVKIFFFIIARKPEQIIKKKVRSLLHIKSVILKQLFYTKSSNFHSFFNINILLNLILKRKNVKSCSQLNIYLANYICYM
jgi:hypothetical protein